MMLQALAAFAERRIADDPNFFDPDFRWEKAAWQIEISRDGKLNGVIPLKVNDGKKWKLKRVRRPYTDVNEISVRSLEKAKSYFLCDTVERVLLYADKNLVSTDPLLIARSRFFLESIKQAVAKGAAANLLGAVVRFLESGSELESARRSLSESGADPGENVVFGVEGADVMSHPEIMDYWREQRRLKAAAGGTNRAVCLVTGELADCVSTANKIKGIGGQDTILISANEQAFSSFGLDKAANSPISVQAEGLVKAALDDLIRKSKEQKLVFNNTIHLHWTRETLTHDPFDLLTTADPEAVAALLKSVREGRQLAAFDANAFYALSLSGNGARVVVRDWLESTVTEVERNIANWFDDIAIDELDGHGVKRDFSLGQLLWQMANPKLKNPYEVLPQNAATQIPRAALSGGPLPQTLLAALLRREVIDRSAKDEKTGKPKPIQVARFAFIKACLLRSPTSQNNNSTTKDKTMTECLNQESRDTAYLCGRLFAVFDRLQYLAQGSVNAGVVERYYASASVTPALVMGRLFRNAQFHLPKAGDGLSANLSASQKQAIAENVRKDFEEIATALGNQFPAALDLEGQGRFALGYYHQKADYRRRTAERKEQQAAEATPATA